MTIFRPFLAIFAIFWTHFKSDFAIFDHFSPFLPSFEPNLVILDQNLYFPHCNFMDFLSIKIPDHVESRFFKNSFDFGRPPWVIVSKNTGFRAYLAYRKFQAIWECIYGGYNSANAAIYMAKKKGVGIFR